MDAAAGSACVTVARRILKPFDVRFIAPGCFKSLPKRSTVAKGWIARSLERRVLDKASAARNRTGTSQIQRKHQGSDSFPRHAGRPCDAKSAKYKVESRKADDANRENSFVRLRVKAGFSGAVAAFRYYVACTLEVMANHRRSCW